MAKLGIGALPALAVPTPKAVLAPGGGTSRSQCSASPTRLHTTEEQSWRAGFQRPEDWREPDLVSNVC